MIAEMLTCIALNVYYEARSEPLEGQYAVAHVVLNRVADDKFPDDACKVVKQGLEKDRNTGKWKRVLKPSFQEIIIMPLSCCIFLLEIFKQVLVRFSATLTNEIVMRLLSAEAGIELSRMRAGHLSEEDWQRMVDKTTQISSAPLFIDDSPNLTMMEIRAKARRMKQKFDLKLVIIDYLQLIKPSVDDKRRDRHLQIGTITAGLKQMAMELDRSTWVMHSTPHLPDHSATF